MTFTELLEDVSECGKVGSLVSRAEKTSVSVFLHVHECNNGSCQCYSDLCDGPPLNVHRMHMLPVSISEVKAPMVFHLGSLSWASYISVVGSFA